MAKRAHFSIRQNTLHAAPVIVKITYTSIGDDRCEPRENIWRVYSSIFFHPPPHLLMERSAIKERHCSRRAERGRRALNC